MMGKINPILYSFVLTSGCYTLWGCWEQGLGGAWWDTLRHGTAGAGGTDSEEHRHAVTDTAKAFGNVATEATVTSLDLFKMPSSLNLSPHLMVSWPLPLIILKWKKKSLLTPVFKPELFDLEHCIEACATDWFQVYYIFPFETCYSKKKNLHTLSFFM